MQCLYYYCYCYLFIFLKKHGLSGTLYKYLDNCVTSSGKRLLRAWICHPLKDVEGINNRLDVVEDMLAHPEVMLLVAQYLRKLPDLERSLGKIRASLHSSATLLLPLLGKKVLKQRVSLLYFCMEYSFLFIYLLFLHERSIKTASGSFFFLFLFVSVILLL